jgi:hypothetical protein
VSGAQGCPPAGPEEGPTIVDGLRLTVRFTSAVLSRKRYRGFESPLRLERPRRLRLGVFLSSGASAESRARLPGSPGPKSSRPASHSRESPTMRVMPRNCFLGAPGTRPQGGGGAGGHAHGAEDRGHPAHAAGARCELSGGEGEHLRVAAGRARELDRVNRARSQSICGDIEPEVGNCVAGPGLLFSRLAISRRASLQSGPAMR